MMTLLLFIGEPPRWETPPWITIIAIGITWIGFAASMIKFRMDLERTRKERDAELREMAMRVCREFTNSKEYKDTKDQRIREISGNVVDEAFARRSSSFVSNDRFDERMRAFENRITNVETAIKENTEKIGEMGGKITQAVTNQLTAYLASRVFGPSEK